MMLSHRKQQGVLFAALAFAVILGAALASDPVVNVDTGAVTMANGTLSQYVTARSVGGITGLCYQNHATKPSYACFRRALQVSGLSDLLSGPEPVTVLAPTDDAFAHLDDTVGRGAFNTFMRSPSATAALIRGSVLPGSTTLRNLAMGASLVTGATAVTTAAGTALGVTFGDLGYDASTSTEVKIGSSDAVDGQSYVVDTSALFPDGSVLIPLGRLTLLSLTD